MKKLLFLLLITIVLSCEKPQYECVECSFLTYDYIYQRYNTTFYQRWCGEGIYYQVMYRFDGKWMKLGTPIDRQTVAKLTCKRVAE
jgi:hypothetical protein